MPLRGFGIASVAAAMPLLILGSWAVLSNMSTTVRAQDGVGGGGLTMDVEQIQPQERAARRGRPAFVYSVKFTCVPEVGPASTGADNPFMPAGYRTVVNVHNFGDDEVTLTKKAVLARSQRQERGPVSNFVEDRLGPNQALGIDCIDIQALFGSTQPVGDGFVELQSHARLNVVAVYTGEVLTPGNTAAR